MTNPTPTAKRKAVKRSTHLRPVGPCPGCGVTIDAELDIATFVGDVVIAEDGTPSVPTSNEITGVRVVHRCDGKPAQQPEIPDTAGAVASPKTTPVKKAAAKKTAAARAVDAGKADAAARAEGAMS